MSSSKVVILGYGGVGKTSLVNRFLHARFVEKYDPTIEEISHKLVSVNGKAMQIEIVDIGWKQDYLFTREAILESHSANSNGYILVYSINDNMTFHALEEIHQLILESQKRVWKESSKALDKLVMPPIVIMGSKLDMTSDPTQRKVTESEARQLTKNINALACFETSAKEDQSVDEVFHFLAEAIYNNTDLGRNDDSCGGVFGAGHSVNGSLIGCSNSTK